MTTKLFFSEIRQKIANDELEETFGHLRIFLENSPLLTELLSQSGRYENLTTKIRQNTLDFERASMEKSEIRKSLLDFMKTLEIHLQSPEIETEMQQAISITTSKNVVVGSTINAKDVHIGDKKIYSESKISKRLRLFLFVFVPLIAITSAIMYYQIQAMSKPLNMKVLIENKDSNPNLPEPIGKLTITYGGEKHSKNSIGTNAIFENIPSNFKDDIFQLKYDVEGFVPIDTSFTYNEVIKITLIRNNDLGVLQGYVYEDGTDPLEGLENVRVSINCCSSLTDTSGHFILDIPQEYQQKKQRLEFFKEGFYQKSTIEPVIKNVEIQTYLIKK